MKYISIVAAIFTGEYVLKNHIEKTRKEGEETELADGKLLVRRYHNRGAFLNLGEKSRPVVAGISVLFCLVLTVLFVITLTRHGNTLLKTGLSILLGGAYSNTYDRLRRKYVVDYFSFGTKGKLRNVVFNLSDFCILIGAMIVVLKTA